MSTKAWWFSGLTGAFMGGIALMLAGCPASPENACDYPGACTAAEGGADVPTDVHTRDRVPGDHVGEDVVQHDARHDAEDAADARDAADASGDAMEEDAGPTCTTGAPPAEGGCITPTSGVFVSTTGMDATGYGSMTMPFASITYALGHLSGATAVYVCGGAYTDQVTVAAGLSLYGGLTCATTPWVYSAAAVAVITATDASFALKVDGVASAVDIEDMEFDGADAVAGGTTIAVWANASSDVSVHRVKIVGATGGAGAKGADGSASPNFTAANADAGAGASSNTGGGGGANSCADGTMAQGGQGGAGGGAPSDGSNGSPPYSPPYPSVSTGLGGSTIACVGGSGGASGSYGEDGGTAGIVAANSGTWSLSSSAWVPSVAGAGTNGGPGQGGGGGGGNTGGGGGGGGAGACGGSAGQGGTSGGASFSLLSLSSTMTLDHCVIQGGAGGAGGDGGDGQAGQGPGGPGSGAGAVGVAGCTGGTGGFGQGGGGGAGGAGGPSAGIAYVGTKPKMTGGASSIKASAVTPTPASGGTGGSGGTVSNPDDGINGSGGPKTVPVKTLMLPTS